jgi:quercetin dioxygenase-like cupin family protein
MKVAKLKEMTKGWFIGNFEPTLFKTNAVEVAVKEYRKGESEDRHYHKIATEITVITKGKVRMNGTIYGEGDILVIKPSEATDFVALTDAMTTVIKLPGANNDKYVSEPEASVKYE